MIAYDDLGTEAIRRLEIEDLPAIVVIDSEGNNLYETAVKEYAVGIGNELCKKNCTYGNSEYSACSVYVVQAVLLCRARRQVSGDHPI